MKVSEVADLADTTVRTIRHYHHLGLVDVPVVVGGTRDYGLDHLALAEKPEPTPRSWWQRQNWACRLGLHALKKKSFIPTRTAIGKRFQKLSL